MADVVTGLIGAALMVAFLVMIAVKINEIALWIVCLSGIALMLWAIWDDAVMPLIGRRKNGGAIGKSES